MRCSCGGRAAAPDQTHALQERPQRKHVHTEDGDGGKDAGFVVDVIFLVREAADESTLRVGFVMTRALFQGLKSTS